MLKLGVSVVLALLFFFKLSAQEYKSSCSIPNYTDSTEAYFKAVFDCIKHTFRECDADRAQFIKKQIGRVDRELYPEELSKLYFELGRSYRDQKLHLKAFSAYFDCKVIIEDFGLFNTITYAQLCEALGHNYYHFREYEKVIYFLKEYLIHPYKKESDLINVNNTIGLAFKSLNELDSAEIYFLEALERAKKEESKVWIGNISGNYADIVEVKGDVDRAEELRELDYTYSIESGNYRSAANLMWREAQKNLEAGNGELALSKMNQSFDLYAMDENPYIPYNLYEIRSKLNYNNGNYKAAARDGFLADRVRDSVNREQQHIFLQRMEFQTLSNSKKSKINELREQQYYRQRQIYIVTGSGLLLLAFMIIILFQQRSKQKKINEVQQVKQNLYREQINTSKEQINGLVKSLRIRNTHIQELTNRMDQVSHTSHEADDEVIQELRDNKILTEEDWVLFKRLFERIYPGFFNEILKLNDQLTKAEIRLAALIKLDLSSLEMSQTLGISKESVRKTNFRLRKKLDIDTPHELRNKISTL